MEGSEGGWLEIVVATAFEGVQWNLEGWMSGETSGNGHLEPNTWIATIAAYLASRMLSPHLAWYMESGSVHVPHLTAQNLIEQDLSHKSIEQENKSLKARNGFHTAWNLTKQDLDHSKLNWAGP